MRFMRFGPQEGGEDRRIPTRGLSVFICIALQAKTQKYKFCPNGGKI